MAEKRMQVRLLRRHVVIVSHAVDPDDIETFADQSLGEVAADESSGACD